QGLRGKPLRAPEPLELAGQTNDQPDERSRAKQAPEPAVSVHRLFPRPDSQADREDGAADVVCRAIRERSDQPAGERNEQRRVRELCDRVAARPALLTAAPKRGGVHQACTFFMPRPRRWATELGATR